MEISPLAGICASSLLVVLVFVVYAFMRGSAGLRSYIVTRLLLTLPMVFILVSVIFFVLRIIPGDPVTSQLGPRGGPEAPVSSSRRSGPTARGATRRRHPSSPPTGARSPRRAIRRRSASSSRSSTGRSSG